MQWFSSVATSWCSQVFAALSCTCFFWSTPHPGLHSGSLRQSLKTKALVTDKLDRTDWTLTLGTQMRTQLPPMNSGELTALVGFVMSDLLSGDALYDIYENRCSKISFCSAVARMRSFHVNNKPVGYTPMNTPRLVHGLSFSSRCSSLVRMR